MSLSMCRPSPASPPFPFQGPQRLTLRRGRIFRVIQNKKNFFVSFRRFYMLFLMIRKMLSKKIIFLVDSDIAQHLQTFFALQFCDCVIATYLNSGVE